MTKAKKASRGARAAKRQTVITLQGSLAPRSWLLSGTALKIGLFAGVAGFVAAPMPALADCAGAGVSFICDSDAAADFPFAPTGAWTGILLGNDDLGGPAQAGGITITNNGDYDGEVDARAGSAVSSATASAFILLNNAPTLSVVTLNLNGDITATNTGSGANGDAVRLAGDILIVNVGSEAELRGSDDGLRVTNVNEWVTLTNHGIIEGQGKINNDAPFGIEVNQGGTTTVAGDVTIDNYGTVTASTSFGGLKASASGIQISTTGNIIITNRTDGVINSDGRGINIQQGATGGNVTIYNDGHIEGSAGNGATINTAGNIRTTNTSFQSWIGALDGINANGNSFDHDNSGGLIWGKAQSGLDIHDVAGVGYANSGTVVVENEGWWNSPTDFGTGGVIAGGIDGIAVNNVTLGHVRVLNSGRTEDHGGIDYNLASGIIIGGTNGVLVSGVSGGSVEIANRNTRDAKYQGIPYDELDADFKSSGIGADVQSYQTQGLGAGIIGGDYGVIVSNVTAGLVEIDNRGGTIIGEAQDGINVTNAAGFGLTIDSKLVDVAFILENGSNVESTLGGLVWGGGDEGVRLDNLGGMAWIENGNGAIAGDTFGIQITNVAGGDVKINSGVGGLIQGLDIDAIQIDNVDQDVAMTNAGDIFAGNRAAYINDVNGDVALNNSGRMIGEGSDGQPVIRIDDVDGNVTIDNDGLIASANLPGITSQASTPTLVPAWVLSPSLISDDLDDLYGFVLDGDVPASWTNIEAYSDAADDLAVNVDADDTTNFTNDGTLVGRVDIDSDDGTTITNDGTWFTRGDSQALGTANSDTITNHGLIQTAFNRVLSASTTLRADMFTNYGTLSMADGGVGDETTVDGDFVGGGALAIDVDFKNADSDFLDLVNGELTGQTGVLVRIVDGGLGGEIGTRIEFANYEGKAAADAFVLDASSDNYVSTSAGGMIADGLLGWYVDQDNWQGYDLVADWGPGAYNAPGVITTAQAAFQSGLGIVEDHMYGDQFGGGGSGADLIVDAPPMDVAEIAAGTTTAAWIKASGDYTTRSTSVTLTPPGVVIDTTSATSVGSVLGGVDVTPDGGDIRVGVFGGYTAAYTDFGGAVTEATMSGVSGGAYAAYNNGEMYADITGKIDYLGVTYDFAGSTAAATALNLGLAANAGYRLDMGGAFVEPLGSLQVVSTSITDTGGIDFMDALSVRGGVGGRIGTEMASEGMVTEVSLLARVWNEFGGPNTVTVTDGVNTVEATDDIAGLYGEIAATATFHATDSGLSGFVTAGSTFSDDSVNYSAKGGLRVGF